MQISSNHPEAMVLGVPVFGPDAPPERVKGRRIGNWFANLETLWGGVHDSLFGFRLYPLKPAVRIMESIRTARRFDFDTELVVRLFWAGVRPINQPVPVHYPPRRAGGVYAFQISSRQLAACRNAYAVVSSDALAPSGRFGNCENDGDTKLGASWPARRRLGRPAMRGRARAIAWGTARFSLAVSDSSKKLPMAWRSAHSFRHSRSADLAHHRRRPRRRRHSPNPRLARQARCEGGIFRDRKESRTKLRPVPPDRLRGSCRRKSHLFASRRFVVGHASTVCSPGDRSGIPMRFLGRPDHAPRFFRSPVGMNNSSIHPVAAELGLRVAGWSVDGCDGCPDAPTAIVSRIMRAIHPGAIVLIHEGGRIEAPASHPRASSG